jgi:hypothetical protein
VQSTSGSQQYNYNAFLDQSVSQPITLQGGFQAVEGALMSTVKSYVAGVTDWIAADVQYNLFVNSGVKVVVLAGTDLSAMTYGTYLSYATAVPAVQPTAGLDWNLIQQLNTLMQEDLRADVFPDGNAQLLTGYSTLNSLRDELRHYQCLEIIQGIRNVRLWGVANSKCIEYCTSQRTEIHILPVF